MKNHKTTISDISVALGISTVSVSRALSGQSGVSEELKNRVFDKAREMGYVMSKKINQVNILILHQKPYKGDNSNFSGMVQGVEKYLQNHNVDYSLEFSDNETQNQMILPYKLSRGTAFDGVILIGRFNLAYAELIKQKIDNLIFFTGYSPSYDFDCVRYNFSNAGYKLCNHLINRGHHTIGYIREGNLFRNKEKLLGIISALEDARLTFNNDYLIDSNSEFPSLISALIKNKNLPSAFICDDDIKAVELIKLLSANQLKVPEDVSVVGSGNTDISSLCTPALTTLDLNIAYACESVVTTLLKRIFSPDKPCESVLVLSTIIERESVRSLNNDFKR